MRWLKSFALQRAHEANLQVGRAGFLAEVYVFCMTLIMEAGKNLVNKISRQRQKRLRSLPGACTIKTGARHCSVKKPIYFLNGSLDRWEVDILVAIVVDKDHGVDVLSHLEAANLADTGYQ